MAISLLDNLDIKKRSPDVARQEFLTIADMAAFREDYLPDFYRCYCKEDGNEYKYKRTNDVDPVLGKWRLVTEGGISDLPTASATTKGGVKIGDGLKMTGEVLSAEVQSDENFTTELKEKLEDIDMSTKVDVEEGKGLSTNDFTDELKAQYDKAEENVQSDWEEEDDTLDSFIKGKPTKLSDFENDPEFITKAVENLENYYKKSEIYTQAEINALLQAINQFNVYLVDVLPELDIDDHAIYFCKKEGAVSDFYEQYIYVQNVWRKIGDTQISLDDYYTKTEADDLLDKKADQETTYTKTETDELLDDKQDVLEFDDKPTEDSDNPVTSTGVKAYVDTEVGKKLDKSFGEENKNKTLKTDENGDVVLSDAVDMDAENVSYENENYEDLTNVKLALNEIFDRLDYKEPKIESFTMTPSTTDYEIGQSVASLNFAWTLNKDVKTQTITGAVITADARSASVSGPFTENKTVTLTVSDGQNSATASKTISFKNKLYIGSAAVPENYDSAFILGLGTKQFATNYKGTFKPTIGSGEYLYIAYPSSWGQISSVYIGGFDTTMENCGDISFTNASGGVVTYNIVKSGRSGLGSITVEVK